RFVGGDYFDAVPINKNKIAFCIADAAGKGLSAALLISNLQAALRPLILKDLPPAEVCSQLNRTLSEIIPDNKFITLFYAVLDAGEGRFTYCNAGHNPPILVRSNGHACQLKNSGAVLGQLPQWSYEQIDLGLRGGDTLLLFTDGLVEVCDEKGNLFGEERLLHLMQELSTSDASANSASALQNSLLANVSAFCQGSFQDDATMLIVRPDRL
ncbi:MAG TPA: PP2C family protein-serine/threonine phosphatase, partial [Candidatus Angelobacter sp.]|nr:PP2C family protein-serine/threonine phosphatase [Candidatus Angelobacter sp.]